MKYLEHFLILAGLSTMLTTDFLRISDCYLIHKYIFA